MTNNNNANLQQVLTDNLQQMADISLNAMKPIMEGLINNFSNVNKLMYTNDGTAFKMPQIKLQSSDCCAPKNECPPHCIASIVKNAMPNERIIVPFTIKNNCSSPKTYRVGLRELKNADGKMASSQPQLNKEVVTLDPGRSERVLMGIDLGKFETGTYTAEIVIREKDINQNICFTLIVDESDGTLVSPQDEQKYKLRWQGWQSHFYCEPHSKPNRSELVAVAQEENIKKV